MCFDDLFLEIKIGEVAKNKNGSYYHSGTDDKCFICYSPCQWLDVELIVMLCSEECKAKMMEMREEYYLSTLPFYERIYRKIKNKIGRRK